MKRIHLIIIALLTVFLSCTNHGDIGPLYGQWVFTSIAINGENADFEPTDYNVRFENNIVMITKKLTGGDQKGYIGRWHMTGHELTLDLTPTVASGVDLPELKLPLAEITLDAKVDGKKMTWTYAAAPDTSIVYTLRKLI